jgi:hypothetical protein
MPTLSASQKAYLEAQLNSSTTYDQLSEAIGNLPDTFHPPDPDAWTQASINYLQSLTGLAPDKQALVDSLQ